MLLRGHWFAALLFDMRLAWLAGFWGNIRNKKVPCPETLPLPQAGLASVCIGLERDLFQN